MANQGGGSKGLVAVIILLILALIVVFVLWQRDQDDMELDVDTGSAGEVVAPVAAPALASPPAALRFAPA